MPSAPARASKLLTPRQLAELLGLSTSTLAKQRMTSHGIPYRKLGASVRYDEADALAWISAHPRRSSTSDNPSAA